MSLLIDAVNWLFGLKTEERKAKAEEEKARVYAMQVLNQEYRIKIEEQKAYIAELEQKIAEGKPRIDMEISYEREIECHRQLIEAAGRERDLKEEIIFLKVEIAGLQKTRNGKH